MNKYAILIGIAGGTGSGKTSIAKAIASDFGKSEYYLKTKMQPSMIDICYKRHQN